MVVQAESHPSVIERQLSALLRYVQAEQGQRSERDESGGDTAECDDGRDEADAWLLVAEGFEAALRVKGLSPDDRGRFLQGRLLCLLQAGRSHVAGL